MKMDEKVKEKVNCFILEHYKNHVTYMNKIFDATNEYFDSLEKEFDRLKEEFCPEMLNRPRKDENGESELIKTSEIDLSSLGNIISNSTAALTDEISKNPTAAVDDGVAKTDEIPQG